MPEAADRATVAIERIELAVVLEAEYGEVVEDCPGVQRGFGLQVLEQNEGLLFVVFLMEEIAE